MSKVTDIAETLGQAGSAIAEHSWWNPWTRAVGRGTGHIWKFAGRDAKVYNAIKAKNQAAAEAARTADGRGALAKGVVRTVGWGAARGVSGVATGVVRGAIFGFGLAFATVGIVPVGLVPTVVAAAPLVCLAAGFEVVHLGGVSLKYLGQKAKWAVNRWKELGAKNKAAATVAEPTVEVAGRSAEASEVTATVPSGPAQPGRTAAMPSLAVPQRTRQISGNELR